MVALREVRLKGSRMEIIPAIDLKNGKAVRLLQGRDEATTEYSTDPVAVAEEWVMQGAARLHVVNLDGAFGRASGNMEVLRKIAGRVDARIEFGGGLRHKDDIAAALDAGVDKIVLGTVAVEQPDLLAETLGTIGADRVIVAIDAVGGKVATRGWRHVTDQSINDFALQMKESGVTEILYTDIERDGMLSGPDLGGLRLLAATGLHVIASGGVSSTEDVRAIASLQLRAIVGVIVGKALYERRVTVASLINALSQP